MERARAADGEEREVTGVEASADRDAADEVGHARVEDVDDPYRGLLDREAERLGDLLADGLRGERLVELPRAAEEVAGGDAAEHDVRVGHRRLRATASVTRRPRFGARALRTDLEESG